MRKLLARALWMVVLTLAAATFAAPASGGAGVVTPDLRPILPIAASGLPSVFVDVYEQPGQLR